MTDKFRRTHPLNITFSDGEEPSSTKLSKVASQARVGARLIEKAVGDIWNQSGDSILNDSPLQITNLARIIGQTKNLNLPLFPPKDSFTYRDNTGTKFPNTNEGYLQFKPSSQSTVTAVVGSTNLTSKKTNDYEVVTAGDWWVDANTGRWKTFSALDSTDKFDYTVDPSTWAITNTTLPGVIPDPRQTTFTGCRVSQTSGVYYLHLPPRQPLPLTGFDLPERYPSSSDQSSNLATATGSPKKLWQSSSVAALADEHYRYRLSKEILDVISSLAVGTTLPEGLLYLWNQNTRTIIEDVVFKTSSTGNWVFEISSETEDFSTKVTSNENQDSYNLTGYSVIIPATSLTSLLGLVIKLLLSGQHNNAGDFNALISHSSLTGLNPPNASFSAHNSHFPSTVPVWAPSKWAYDDHISLLSRAGSQGVAGGKNRDINDNAMLGDLTLASTSASGGNYLNKSASSNKLLFGTSLATSGPALYGEVRSSAIDGDAGYGLRLDNCGLDFGSFGTGISFTGESVSTKWRIVQDSDALQFLSNVGNSFQFSLDGIFGTAELSNVSAIGSLLTLTQQGTGPSLTIAPENTPTTNVVAGSTFVLNSGVPRLQISDGTNWNKIAHLVYNATSVSSNLTGNAESAFSLSYTIPPDSLVAGSLIRFRATGLVTNQNANDTLTVRVRIGGLSGTLIVASSSVDPATNDGFVIDGYLVIRTAGGTGTCIGGGRALFTTSVVQGGGYAMTTAASIDTTSSQSLVITGQWSTASASNVCRLDTMNVEIE